MTNTNANTNTKASDNAVKASTMQAKLCELAKTYADFEAKELIRTNQRLYEILADVYASYEEAAQSPLVLDVTLDALTEELKVRGKRVQRNSNALSVFVRYVFNSDRQRIFTYTRAIQAAKAQNIAPSGFVEFVNNSGGLEDCKAMLSVSEGVAPAKQQMEEGIAVVDEILAESSSETLAEFKVDAAMVSGVKANGMTFMVGTCDEAGNVKVRFVVPAYSESFAKWAKRKIAEYMTSSDPSFSSQAPGKDHEAELNEMLDEAVSIAAANASKVAHGSELTDAAI